MEGYVKNIQPGWVHSMKREVGPGEKIPLSSLYDQYGKKHGIEEGDKFVSWLRDVKLKDTSKWQIVCATDEVKEEHTAEAEQVPITNAEIRKFSVRNVQKADLSVEDVVELSVRNAKKILPSIRDVKLLKYAYQEANVRAHKESLTRMLRKRIGELEAVR